MAIEMLSVEICWRKGFWELFILKDFMLSGQYTRPKGRLRGPGVCAAAQLKYYMIRRAYLLVPWRRGAFGAPSGTFSCASAFSNYRMFAYLFMKEEF